MIKDEIKLLIEQHIAGDGLVKTVLPGVQLFRVTEAEPCVPVVYEPTLVAIVSGVKEAILDGRRYVYDSSQYMVCPMTMPVEAGTPQTTEENPLIGVMVSLEPSVLRQLALELEVVAGSNRKSGVSVPKGLALVAWDEDFSLALLRLLSLLNKPGDAAILGETRLRELFYFTLKGEGGAVLERAFGVGNEIARIIEYLSTRLDEPVSVDDMASHVGMSRAVFHRRFKEATTMSPIQYIKTMRLNKAAMKISEGVSVSQAAWGVGYSSASQFSREFKRMYGLSPRQWRLKEAVMGF